MIKVGRRFNTGFRGKRSRIHPRIDGIEIALEFIQQIANMDEPIYGMLVSTMAELREVKKARDLIIHAEKVSQSIMN